MISDVFAPNRVFFGEFLKGKSSLSALKKFSEFSFLPRAAKWRGLMFRELGVRDPQKPAPGLRRGPKELFGKGVKFPRRPFAHSLGGFRTRGRFSAAKINYFN